MSSVGVDASLTFVVGLQETEGSFAITSRERCNKSATKRRIQKNHESRESRQYSQSSHMSNCKTRDLLSQADAIIGQHVLGKSIIPPDEENSAMGDIPDIKKIFKKIDEIGNLRPVLINVHEKIDNFLSVHKTDVNNFLSRICKSLVLGGFFIVVILIICLGMNIHNGCRLTHHDV